MFDKVDQERTGEMSFKQFVTHYVDDPEVTSIWKVTVSDTTGLQLSLSLVRRFGHYRCTFLVLTCSIILWVICYVSSVPPEWIRSSGVFLVCSCNV